MKTSHLTEGESTLAVLDDSDAIEIQRLPADVTSFEPGAPHAGANTLDNKVAFQLGRSEEHTSELQSPQ